MKKILIGCLIALLLTTGCTTSKPKATSEPTEETITLQIKIVDASQTEEKILFEDEIQVPASCGVLACALEAEELEVVTKKESFGSIILGMKNTEGNWDKGPWWSYTSENNKSCVELGYCDGIDTLPIQDQDSFVFVLTSNF